MDHEILGACSAQGLVDGQVDWAREGDEPPQCECCRMAEAGDLPSVGQGGSQQERLVHLGVRGAIDVREEPPKGAPADIAVEHRCGNMSEELLTGGDSAVVRKCVLDLWVPLHPARVEPHMRRSAHGASSVDE